MLCEVLNGTFVRVMMSVKRGKTSFQMFKHLVKSTIEYLQDAPCTTVKCVKTIIFLATVWFVCLYILKYEELVLPVQLVGIDRGTMPQRDNTRAYTFLY